jgi:hypothetical protein
MDKRKSAPRREPKPKSSQIDINIISEYHQEKAGYPLKGEKENAAQRKINKTDW